MSTPPQFGNFSILRWLFRGTLLPGEKPKQTPPRVGIAWSGNLDHNNDQGRSIRFERLSPLFAADVDWPTIVVLRLSVNIDLEPIFPLSAKSR